MSRSLPRLCIGLTAAVMINSYGIVRAQRPVGVSPPIPFEDVGACPFEGCAYREWTAKEAIAVRTERRKTASITFRLKQGEKVTALTGIVMTVRPGRVQFRETTNLSTGSGQLRVDPGQTLYLLTYQGEGFTKAWFNGRLYSNVDTKDFLNGRCDREPSQCAGRVLEQPRTEWWVQVRNRFGRVGWTNEPDRFDGKDVLG